MCQRSCRFFKNETMHLFWLLLIKKWLLGIRKMTVQSCSIYLIKGKIEEDWILEGGIKNTSKLQGQSISLKWNGSTSPSFITRRHQRWTLTRNWRLVGQEKVSYLAFALLNALLFTFLYLNFVYGVSVTDDDVEEESDYEPGNESDVELEFDDNDEFDDFIDNEGDEK